jgi:hypothetical protein
MNYYHHFRSLNNPTGHLTHESSRKSFLRDILVRNSSYVSIFLKICAAPRIACSAVLCWRVHKRSLLNTSEINLIVRFEVLTAVVMKSPIFWDITPCSPLKVNRQLATCFHAGILLGLFDSEDRGSVTLVNFQRTTRRYIPEDSTLDLNRLLLLILLLYHYYQ